MGEAVAAWRDTRQNLDSLCTRYQEAVRLWSQYRQASEQVKQWADQQFANAQDLNPDPDTVKVRNLYL